MMELEDPNSRALYQREKDRRAMEAGICRTCSQPVVAPGRTRCRRCLDGNILAVRRYKARRLGHVVLTPTLPRPIDLTPTARKRLAAASSAGVGHKEPFPERFKRAIKERDGRCVGDGRYWESCDGAYPLEHCQVDHIDPDGDHSMENGQTLCQNCHGIKCATERAQGRDLDWAAA